MRGAILGDIIGSVYEHNRVKTTDFEIIHPFNRFTDDTVLTVAVADAILNGKTYEDTIRFWGMCYPNAGYGGNFYNWLKSENPRPYNSWGNGSAMRVSPVGFAFDSLERVLEEAERSAVITHNHPEGIKGAKATAASVFLARYGSTKEEIKDFVSVIFDYDLNRTIDEIRPGYSFDVSCQGSVPESIIAFLESTNYENAVRLAISLGGDADTQACIAGGIAQAFYKKIPKNLIDLSNQKLPESMLEVLRSFEKKYSPQF